MRSTTTPLSNKKEAIYNRLLFPYFLALSFALYLAALGPDKASTTIQLLEKDNL